jgi:DNA polymerase III gamma/tau subunit
MKKHHVKPKNEDGMSDAENNPTGPKFVGKMKGTDPAGARYNKYVGGESVLRDYEQVLREPRHRTAKDLMREYKEFVAEYGGVGGYGAASQAPQGSSQPNPAQLQQKADADQIKKSTNLVAPTLNAQGAAVPLDKVKFGDVMNKLDVKSNQQLPASDTKQLQPLAVAASKALQNPQTANQFKQVVTKADQLDQAKEKQVQQAQQKVGTNAPAGQQQPQSTSPSNQPPVGATK